MASLTKDLSAAASAAFEAMGLEARWGEVRRSDKPELADFQCNGAMGAAKKAGKVPRDVAAEVAAALKAHPMVLSAEVAGPGFINIRVSDEALSARAETVRAEAMAGAEPAADAQVTVIDFGGPNVAKPMHVGHLRSAVIGDTLVRLLRFLGDDVTGDTHLGDWGLQMGLLIVAVKAEQPELVYFDAEYTGPYPDQSPVTIKDLERLYPLASARSKEDAEYKTTAERAVAEMQAGRPGYRALLRHFIDVSVEALKVDYEFLNVHFDLWKGESDVEDLIPTVVEQFKKAGLSEFDQGELIVRVARETDKKELPPVKLINKEGGTGYHMTDLATILDRMENLHPTPQRMLYVVDQRQALHFEQVFRAAEMVGLIDEGRLEHIGFGTVNGPDGKPFKTREGGVLRLADLNAMALEEAQKKIKEAGKIPEDMGPEERHQVAANVALAALRFSDLMNTRTTNYVFDLDKFTSFEGKTGPYLLYAAVRVKSLLRRAEADGNEAGAIAIGQDAERALVLQLDHFAAACLQAREKRMPHVLCEHLYNLAQAFSAFYAALPIAAENGPATRASRLGLASAVLKQLETGLDLLGIRVPERM